MRYLGIDPGFHGAAAQICRGRLLTHEWHSTEQAWQWLRSRRLPALAVLERVTRPCKLTANAGEWRAFLIAAEIPYVEVRPQEWQKYFGKLPKERTKRKNKLKRIAQKRFPSKKVTLANADAILLAIYCKENLDSGVKK